MKIKYFILLLLVLSFQNIAFTQDDKFMEAMDLMKTNPAKAKSIFLDIYSSDEPHHGACHFLGVLYLDENKMDSAIFYFEKSIELNKKNVNKTKEMTYVRIIQTYSQMLLFEKALTRGWEGLTEIPDSKMISTAIEDACLWSYYINQQELNPDYIKSTKLKDEYVVRSIPQEYLILRTIRIDGEYLNFTGQSLVYKKNHAYDVLSAETSKTEKKYDVMFRLDWDMSKEFGGRKMNTKEVSNDYTLPASQIVGARLIENRKIDLKETVQEVLKNKIGK